MMKKAMLVISLCTVMTLKPASYWDTITTMFRAAEHKITAIASAFKSKAINAQQSITETYRKFRQTKKTQPFKAPEQKTFVYDDFYDEGKTYTDRIALIKSDPDTYKDAKYHGDPLIIWEINNLEPCSINNNEIKQYGRMEALRKKSEGCSLDVINTLLASEADVNATDTEGMTPLMHAINKRRLWIVHHLLSAQKQDVMVKDRRGFTALMYAAGIDIDLVPEIIKKVDVEHKNEYINMQNDEGKTALIRAIELNQPLIVEELVKSEADVTPETLNMAVEKWRNFQNTDKEYIADSIIRHLLKGLFNKDNFIFSEWDNDGETLLTRAAADGNYNMVRDILSKKYNADKNFTNKSDKTALEIAEAAKKIIPETDIEKHKAYEKIITLLGAPKHKEQKSEMVPNTKQSSPPAPVKLEQKTFEYKNFYGEGKTCDNRIALIKAYPDTCKDIKFDGEPLLIWEVNAMKKCGIDVINTLLAHGADVNATDINGMTALMHAIDKRGANKFIDALLAAQGQDVTKKDRGDNTVLMYAAWRNIDFVNKIIEKVSSGRQKEYVKEYINTQNNEKKTALMRAVEYGKADIVETLIGHGADATAKMLRVTIEALQKFQGSDREDDAMKTTKLLLGALLETDKDKNILSRSMDVGDRTLLQSAVINGNYPMVQILVEKYGDKISGQKQKALELAQKNDKIIKLLETLKD
ncbi:MAG: ankyrin repeat domain-containing protein [Candidatus Babeliaceae bacterium]|jgi:ankyrin repeat protein